MMTRLALASAALAALSAAGCTDRPTLIPNSDPALNKTGSEIATEAVKRFPYPANLARADKPLPVRAELGYVLNEISLVNFGDADWKDIEVWVNGRYVVPLTSLESKKVKKIPFEVLYNGTGQHFPRDNTRIEKLELRMNDVMYDVTTQLGQ